MKKAMEYFYRTTGTCSRAIRVVLDGDIIESVTFDGGCSGNTQGVSALVKGMDAHKAIELLSGIRCGFKSTSCPDQLSVALRQALEKQGR